MYSDLPAKNTVFTPYIPINVWFWPTPLTTHTWTGFVKRPYECALLIPSRHAQVITTDIKRVDDIKWLGLARTVYIHRIFGDSLPKIQYIHTVFIWFWPTLKMASCQSERRLHVQVGISCSFLGLARTIYIRCIHGIYGKEITKYTVIYGVCAQFWPTLFLSRWYH